MSIGPAAATSAGHGAAAAGLRLRPATLAEAEFETRSRQGLLGRDAAWPDTAQAAPGLRREGLGP